MDCSLVVVPANAGTHTPRPFVVARWLTTSAPTNAVGYGSLRSQGRRQGFGFQTVKAIRTVVIPAQAGIQYAATFRIDRRRLWNTGSFGHAGR
jgi:hypothetical protein